MSRSRLFIALLLAGTGLAGRPVLAQEDAVVPPPGVDGNFIIGQTHAPAPEMTVKDDVPHGKVFNLTIDEVDTDVR